MDRQIISWTPENWLTVFLMTWGGFLVLAIIVNLVHKFTGKSDG